MISSYFKSACRNIYRHKNYSFINIFGLAIGMAGVLLVALWIQDEVNYDRFHKNANEICRVVMNYDGKKIPTCPGPLGGFLKNEIPEIINSTRFHGWTEVFQYKNQIVRQQGLSVEPSFLEMFSFPLLKGDPATALNDVGSIVISEEMAQKLFGNEDPIGKTIVQSHKWNLKVTGVVQNVPANSSPPLKFTYLTPFKVLKFFRKPDSWEGEADYVTWVQLNKHSSLLATNQKLKALLQRHTRGTSVSVFLQPLTRIHLHSKLDRWDGPHGDIQYVIIFALVGLFILLIACVNYMNLATARALHRAKEVGIRRVVGASRGQLIKQFFGESLLFAVLAFPLAMLLVEFSLPLFQNLSGKAIELHYSEPQYFFCGIALIFFTGFLSGLYPALFLSAFTPVKILKGFTELNFILSKNGNWQAGGFSFRKSLVIFQFTLSILVIICTLTIFRQLNFIQNKNLGFEKQCLLYVPLAGDESQDSVVEIMKQEMLKHPFIESVTTSDNSLVSLMNVLHQVEWNDRGLQKNAAIPTIAVDYDYLETYQMKLAAGRFFSQERTSESGNTVVVNESAVRALNLEEPLGAWLKVSGKNRTIIGIVKDFNFQSLHHSIKPCMFVIGDKSYIQTRNLLNIRTSTGFMSETITLAKKLKEQYAPNIPFEYHFLDDKIAQLYRSEQRLGNLFLGFAVLTIFISCLGLFGLVTFLAERRTKEIGIRKVLGASIGTLVALLTKDFTRWVLLANLVAWPVAFLAMQRWLENFAYRIDSSLWTYLGAGFLALVIALLTVSVQAIRAAIANPVKALRYE